MARYLSLEVFGIYTLLFTTYLIIIGLANTVVSEPIRVFAASLSEHELSRYLSCQLIFRAVAALFAGMIGFLVCPLMGHPGGDLAVSFAFFIMASQLHELGRATNSARRRWTSVLTIDVLYFIIRFALFGILVGLKRYSLGNALSVMAIGALIGGLYQPLAGIRFKLPKPLALQRQWHLNWTYGHWIFLESVVFVASSQIYVYLVAAWVDTRSAGGLNAAQSIVNLLNILLTSVTVWATPLARHRLLIESYARWRALLIQVGIAACGLCSVIAVALVVGSQQLFALFFGRAYLEFASLLLPLSLAMVLAVANGVFGVAFRTAEMTKVGFISKTVSAVITCLAAYPLITNYGVLGAAIGLLLTQACWTSVYLYQIFSGKALAPDRIKVSLKSL
ncbi:MAG: hypothetical protein HYX63_04415 [Gammaproteobacteria bacterium]|nr:hypothetical protein [Gammaproteobacteria bacterium]